MYLYYRLGRQHYRQATIRNASDLDTINMYHFLVGLPTLSNEAGQELITLLRENSYLQ